MPPSLHLVKKTLYILGKRCYNKNMQKWQKTLLQNERGTST